MISQIGINYRDGSLSKHGETKEFKIKAGDRMPYFLVEGKSIYDQLHEPKFHLLVFSDGESDYQTIRNEIESGHAGLLDFQVVPIYPHVAEIFGTDKPFNLLLRPDNHVGFISRETSLRGISIYLNEVIGRS